MWLKLIFDFDTIHYRFLIGHNFFLKKELVKTVDI